MSPGRSAFAPGDEGVELDQFELLLTEGGRYSTPGEVVWEGTIAARAPSTVAAALSAAGRLDLSHPPKLDALDAWYRAALPASLPQGSLTLTFGGLATLTDVWLDGEPLFSSESMFVEHAVNVTDKARPGSLLVMRFRALGPHIARRRPRPRWRTRIVDHQQLRWVRTSLIGRTPGFCPEVPAVGPYRPIRLRSGVRASDVRIVARPLGPGGEVLVSLCLEGGGSEPATLVVEGLAGSGRTTLLAEESGGAVRYAGRLELTEISRWWPHTHGAQPRSRAQVLLQNGRVLELGSVGFRDIDVDRGEDGRGFGLTVNGVPIFCRGACWTTDDILTLGSADLRGCLERVRSAGMNMLRIPGIASYEAEAFHELCDELGILVFQDFMFANMDYPAEDSAWMAEVEAEARAVLGRIGFRPSTAVLCGNSEVEQQASMLGMPKELWKNVLFHDALPRLTAELSPGVPYVPATPFGGDLPFHTDEGLTHYYGVGAYLRPIEDARRSRVRFTPECLAFANVPSNECIERFMGDLDRPHHHPRWKERVPRDRGVGWDFEDVRDHYVRTLFQVQPETIRYADPERYLALGRAAVGHVMEATFSEFRCTGSSCRGALVFWLKDYWDGAGWGIWDAGGGAKSAHYHLSRVMQPVTVLMTDEGLNGVFLHVVNECEAMLEAKLRVTHYRDGETVVVRGETRIAVPPRGTSVARGETLLERFSDSTFAYRFGPPGHDVVLGELLIDDAVHARAFHLPLGLSRPVEPDLGLKAQFETRDAIAGLAISTRRFAQNVSIEVPGHTPADDSFHLEPGGSRFVPLTSSEKASGPARGTVRALNGATVVAVKG